jgi:uncharacterized protein YdiU (UPF0061 family)
MHGLGIPTTRALAIATSDEWVYRHGAEPRASLLRLTPSHIRFGHFQYAATTRFSELTQFADYVIARHFPALLSETNPYMALLEEVITRTARLIAQWQAAGFNHGVMNSDNMSILGETFDYGPFAFMDVFNSRFVCNDSDDTGRYAFCNQPGIGLWNLERLAEALAPLAGYLAPEKILAAYAKAYNATYLPLMATKLGLDFSLEDEADFKVFLAQLLNEMELQWIDYPSFFGQLTGEVAPLHAAYPGLKNWIAAYEKRLAAMLPNQVAERLAANNPKLYLRNAWIEKVIQSAYAGDFAPFEAWWKAVSQPYEVHAALHGVADLAPEGQAGMTCSCSS